MQELNVGTVDRFPIQQSEFPQIQDYLWINKSKLRKLAMPLNDKSPGDTIIIEYN